MMKPTTHLAVSAALLFVAVAVAVWPSPPSAAEEADAPGIQFHKDVVYGMAGDEELLLNVAVPAGLSGPAPTVAVIHGGAWMSGRKEWHDKMIRWLATKGYVAATIGYRLAREDSRWPAQINDVKCAIRYLRANAAKWNIDPDRIAAWGFSAGGHLSMLLGAMGPDDGLEGDGGHADFSSRVDAVVSFYGPTDLDPMEPGRLEQIGKTAIANILGPEFVKDPKKASPVHYIGAGDAPMLLIQGTRDRLVPYLQAVDMLSVLSEKRVDAEVVFLVGQGHGWKQDPALSDSVRTGLRFLDRRFRPELTESIRDEVMRVRSRRKGR